MNMGSIHKALIEAIVYIESKEGTDDEEDDDVRALEEIMAELQQAEPSALRAFLATVESLYSKADDPGRKQCLQAILDTLSE